MPTTTAQPMRDSEQDGAPSSLNGVASDPRSPQPEGEVHAGTSAPADAHAPAEAHALDDDPGELRIRLEQYEGPLDLLLDLIRRQKLDIHDIPIARVTAQYLQYLRLMRELNVNVASDFLLIAAQLIYIKSRTLLPVDPDQDAEDEDPREELVRRLLEYEKFRNAAEMLHQKELVEKAAFTRSGKLDLAAGALEPEMTVTLVDLMSVFRDIMKRMEERPTLDFRREQYTVGEMARMMARALAASPGGVSFRDIMARFDTRAALITAFLAILEMAKLHIIRIGQKSLFDDIQIRIESGASVDDERLQHLSLN